LSLHNKYLMWSQERSSTVSADGQRFLVGAVVDEGGGSPITVVLNWTRLFEH
jgi:hypothetical protein